MKKTFTKPTIEEIQIAPNQAIAACGGSVTAVWQAYDDRNLARDKMNAILATDENYDLAVSKVKSQNKDLFKAYWFKLNNQATDGTGHIEFLFEDLDGNEKWSNGDNIQVCQIYNASPFTFDNVTSYNCGDFTELILNNHGINVKS